MKKQILVTGSAGQLGSELKSLALQNADFNFAFTDHKELDITSVDGVNLFLADKSFDFLINCAAYTAVDKAESDKETAFSINALASGILAESCKTNNIRFVHISTDFVFDGNLARPLVESDVTNALSVYGVTKLAGEEQVLDKNNEAIIIRTSWVYSSFGNNFVKTILRLCRERDSLGIIYDQIGTPTYAGDLAAAILEIIRAELWVPGVFHYSNEGVASWYDFAIAIRDNAGLKTAIRPIETNQYPTPAIRPKYSVLNKGKIKKEYNLHIPYWRDSLLRCMDLMK